MHDLNIKSKGTDKDKLSNVKRALELGWDFIAWNVTATGKANNQLSNKHTKSIQLSVSDAQEAISGRSLTRQGLDDRKTITQYNRITVTVDDLADAQLLTTGNEILRSYDIVAACPGNAKIFSYLCRTAEVDIVSINFAYKVPFTLNKKLLDEAVSRGVFFEIVYSPLLFVSQARREILSGTRLLVQFLRGRNLVLSSGAESVAQLRSPFDVLNVAKALNLTAAQAKEAISDNCAELLKRCSARRLRFLPAEVLSLEAFHQRSAAGGTVRQPRPTKRDRLPASSGSSSSDEDSNSEQESEDEHSAKRRKTPPEEANRASASGGDMPSSSALGDDDFIKF